MHCRLKRSHFNNFSVWDPTLLYIESAKTRIFFTFISNILRGGFSFLAGLIVARGLGPNLYGDFIFLIASFAAIRQVLDLGTSSAFYTFLSNRPQGLKFLTFYLIWQLVQFLFPIIIIGLFLPEAMLNQIWLGEERELILLSFMAVFMKEQAWTTMVYLGESNRLTIKVQFSNILIAITHLLIISLLWITHFLSIQLLFVLIISEYVIACLIAFKFLYVSYPDTEKLDGKTILKKYYTYCIPLVFSSCSKDDSNNTPTSIEIAQGVWNVSPDCDDINLLGVTLSLDTILPETIDVQAEGSNSLFIDVNGVKVSAEIDNSGNVSGYSDTITYIMVLANDENLLIPTEFSLHQNYPNPFNPTTQIKYDLPEDALVTINIYDLMGRIVKNLVNGQKNAGYNSIQWNATNDKGATVSAGLYLCTIQAGEFRQTKKMVLLK